MKTGGTLALATLCLLAIGGGASTARNDMTYHSASHVKGTRKSAHFGDVRFAHMSASVAGAPSVGSITTREGLGENVPYPGSEFIGIGYDALKGNPSGDGVSMKDPGIKGPALRFGYCQSDACLTRDMVHLRPMKSTWGSNPTFTPIVWARPEASCEQSKRARTLFTASDYSKSLSIDAEVSASAGFFGGSAEFSASAGMDQFMQEVRNSGSQKYSMKSYCLMYSLGFPHERYNVESLYDPVMKEMLDSFDEPRDEHGDFNICADAKARERCITYTGYERALEFFKTFGTHFIYEVSLGGKFVVDVTIKEDSRNTQETEDIRASIEASFDGFGASGSASLNTASSVQAQFSLQSKSKDVSVSVLGGSPPSDSDDIFSSEAFGEWAATVADNPMPVQYKLAPISTSEAFKAAASIYGQNLGKKLPASSGIRRPYRPTMSTLSVGEKLYPTQSLVSKNGRVVMTLTENGVIEVRNQGKLRWQSWLMCPEQPCSQEAFMALSYDCKLEVYENGKAFWKSNNRKCVGPDILYMQDDGNLVIYDTKGRAAWSAGVDGLNSRTLWKYLYGFWAG